MVLSDLAVGSKALIKGFAKGDTAYRHKLLSMGLTRGTELLLERRAPLGDPLQVVVRGFSLSLRMKDAQMICIEVLNV